LADRGFRTVSAAHGLHTISAAHGLHTASAAHGPRVDQSMGRKSYGAKQPMTRTVSAVLGGSTFNR
jgi:hypothetical protein